MNLEQQLSILINSAKSLEQLEHAINALSYTQHNLNSQEVGRLLAQGNIKKDSLLDAARAHMDATFQIRSEYGLHNVIPAEIPVHEGCGTPADESLKSA